MTELKIEQALLRAAEALERAADLIEPEGAWTAGAFARSRHGYPIGPETPGATCWCAMGALIRVTGPNLPIYAGALSGVINQVGEEPHLWNDAPGRTQAEVVAMFRKTAGLLRGGLGRE